MASSLELFLDVLGKSGLIADDEVKNLLNKCSRPVSCPKDEAEKLQRFLSLAKDEKLLTEWQISKIQANRFKGFFWENYVFLDYLGEMEDVRAYLARQTISPYLEVVLELKRPLGSPIEKIETTVKYFRGSERTPEVRD